MAKLKPNVPEELLIEIVSRVPAKSVGRCRCVAKSWKTSLSTPHFINLHVSRSSKHHQDDKLLLISGVRSLHTISSFPVKKMNLLPNTWLEVLGSCHGLVLLLSTENELFLVNPTTQEQFRVPNSPFAQKEGWVCKTHGFGYDSSTDDYKIVTLSVDRPEKFVFDVYSVKTGVWKRVACDFPGPIYTRGLGRALYRPGALANRALHWFTLGTLIAFDLASEVLSSITLPYEARSHTISAVSVLRGCLILVTGKETFVVEVWLMKDYGVQDSWTKFTFDDIALGPHYFTCFIGEEEVVVVTLGSLLVCDMRTQTMKPMVVDGAPASFLDGCAFGESLISPNQLMTREE